ncbi:SDR family NAD(P)-dependent oxidoreductase [Streptomyces sp. BPTC-684]|uniref:SDR family NAD(P)-dependent oxidoreductase n=1 Tax=Streptomyces sp. BPTC-684 TaxID=3043734 RepID=UPI0024B1595D|nr:SDR family NAD(P)-dependent oxidoreductase [Streptomyces sp. BPTC-684]WHM41537.1 SDR family NAD(P)-dependent oxidoreductase [Streptomyces sp. BPTC-684]
MIHISSAAGVEGWPYASAYAAAKAAGISLCRDLARELACEPVKMFACHPGILETGLTEAVLREPQGGDRWRRLHAAWFARQIRDGRTVPVPVAARVVLALACGAYDDFSGRYLTTGGLSGLDVPE